MFTFTGLGTTLRKMVNLVEDPAATQAHRPDSCTPQVTDCTSDRATDLGLGERVLRPYIPAQGQDDRRRGPILKFAPLTGMQPMCANLTIKPGIAMPGKPGMSCISGTVKPQVRKPIPQLTVANSVDAAGETATKVSVPASPCSPSVAFLMSPGSPSGIPRPQPPLPSIAPHVPLHSSIGARHPLPCIAQHEPLHPSSDLHPSSPSNAKETNVAQNTAMKNTEQQGPKSGQLTVRDFLRDVVVQRTTDKEEEAEAIGRGEAPRPPGKIWDLFATEGIALAPSFTHIAFVITTIKCFASVRYAKHDIYLRMLQEIPRLLPQSTPIDLVQLLRLLCRRRLQVQDTIDVLCSALMEKSLKQDARRAETDPYNTFITIPRRLVIKCANALSALDVCGSGCPRFTEFFLHFITSRLDMFDATLMSQWNPLFIVNYCTDAARQAILSHMVSVDAGFQTDDGCNNDFDNDDDDFDEQEQNCDPLSNVALMVHVLRKDTFDASITQYFDKVEAESKKNTLAGVTISSSSSSKRDARAALTRHVVENAELFSSALHRDVSACLTALGVAHENSIVRGPYVCDIVSDLARKRVIYECNAPDAFYVAKETPTYTAARRMRHAVICEMAEREGASVVMVDHAEWDAMSQEQRLSFLRQKGGST